MAERLSLVGLVMAVNDRLTEAGIGHGFGGAIALAYYVDRPRATRDLDVNIAVPVEEAASVFSVLPDGVEWGDDDVARCRGEGQVRLWYGRRRDGIPIDLFFPQHPFHRAVARQTRMRVFARPDYQLPVIAATHLLVFKALFDRPQDWVDIQRMIEAGSVDLAEARRWLADLLGSGHPALRRLAEVAAAAVAAPRQPEQDRPRSAFPTRPLAPPTEG